MFIYVYINVMAKPCNFLSHISLDLTLCFVYFGEKIKQLLFGISLRGIFCHFFSGGNFILSKTLEKSLGQKV